MPKVDLQKSKIQKCAPGLTFDFYLELRFLYDLFEQSFERVGDAVLLALASTVCVSC